MTMNLSNGTLRKSLASQLDRLDTILDGLADGLNAAVKDAVAGAVKESVHGILNELLKQPEFLARMHGTTHTAAGTTPTEPFSIRKCLRRVCGWISSRCRRAYDAACRLLSCLIARCHRGLEQACDVPAIIWAQLLALHNFKRPVLRAVAIGAAVGMAVYFAEPWLAAGVSGIGGFGTALAVQGGLWLRQVFGETERAGS